MDQGIGRIIAELKRSGRFADTLILFGSDNGVGVHKGATFNSLPYYVPVPGNGPFRGGKWTPWEGGVRVPFIVHLPDGVAKTSDALVSMMDVLPTALDYAGIKTPEGYKLDGHSFLPILQGKAEGDKDRTICWAGEAGDPFPEDEWNPAYAELAEKAKGLKKGSFVPCWYVRTPQWKLMAWDTLAPALIDMTADPHEWKEVSRQNPQVVAELTQRFKTWIKAQKPPLYYDKKQWEKFFSDRRAAAPTSSTGTSLLKPDDFKRYVDQFNADDPEPFKPSHLNERAWDFLKENIPLLDCPDKELEKTYYFRWWTFRKHLRQTPDGWVITEFLPPVPWARRYNTINCAAGHQVREGRWLADRTFVRDYLDSWLRKGGEPRRYSFWIADSVMAWCDVTGDYAPAKHWLPELVKNYEAWEEDKLDVPGGMFWQWDGADGMERSISGSGFRPTPDSFQIRFRQNGTWADAQAMKGTLTERSGWNKIAFAPVEADAVRLEVAMEGATCRFAPVRELIGYVPWYFNLPDPRHASGETIEQVLESLWCGRSP